MSEEQSPTGKEGGSVDALRRAHQLGRASCARPYVGTDLTRIVDQVAIAARSPVLEAVRQVQRSWVSPLLAQQHSALAALAKAALSKIETPYVRVPGTPWGLRPGAGKRGKDRGP